MNQTKIELGIVLKATPIGEANLRLHILTQNGIITATATGAQKPTAKLKSAAQIFTIAEFQTTQSRLTSAHVILSPMPLTREINRYYLACSIAEVLLQIKNHAPYGAYLSNYPYQDDHNEDAQIFVLTVRTFEELINTTTSAYKIFINYFSQLLTLLGFNIELEIPEALGLAAAKKLVIQINAAYIEHLDMSIPCVPHFV